MKGKLNSLNQIKYGAIISYVLIFFNTLSGLLYTPWMVRVIGQEDYGLYTLALSVINIFLLDFGLSAAVSKFVAKYNAENDQKGVDNILGIAYKLYLVLTAAILIILLLIYFNLASIYQGLTTAEMERFKVVYLIASVFSIVSFPFTPTNGILTAYEKLIELKVCDLLNKVCSTLFIIIALFNGYGLYTLVATNAISGLIAILFKYIIIRKKTNARANFRYKNSQLLKELSSFSVWSAIISIAQRFIFNITPTILGIFSKASSIAIFGIASSLEGYIYTFASALNGLFLLRVTKLVQTSDGSEGILKLMIKVGRIQYLILSVIIIGFISIGNDFVYLWMGVGYEDVFISALLLIFPSIFYLPQQIGNTAVIAMNKIKNQAIVFLIMAVVNIILSVILSGTMGIVGASLSICIAYLIRTIGMNYIYHKQLHINMFTFFKECHLKLFIPTIISLIFSLLINYLFQNISWYILVIKGTIIVSFYCLIMWRIGLDNYEKNLVFSMFKRKLI